MPFSFFRPVINITVIARESGSPLSGTAQVIIQLTDVNDNTPVFQPSPIALSVQENQPVPTQVGTVRATDSDSGVNQEVTATTHSSGTAYKLLVKSYLNICCGGFGFLIIRLRFFILLGHI